MPETVSGAGNVAKVTWVRGRAGPLASRQNPRLRPHNGGAALGRELREVG